MTTCLQALAKRFAELQNTYKRPFSVLLYNKIMTKNIKLVIYREEMTSSSQKFVIYREEMTSSSQQLVIYREEMTSSPQKISDL